jgi:hypothetical protein
VKDIQKEINLVDNIYKNNVYSKDIPMWHKKGEVGKIGETAANVYSRMECVEFIAEAFSATVKGKKFDSKTTGIFRVEGDKVIEIGDFKGTYEISQPSDYINAFDEYVKVDVETLGFLGAKADKLFITWVLPKIDVYGDIIKMFGLLSTGFNGSYGSHLYATSIRTICWNTHALAIQNARMTQNDGRGANSHGAIYSERHNQVDHIKNLGLWMKYIHQDASNTVKMMQDIFCHMQSTPVDADTAHGLFSKVYEMPKQFSDFCPPELIDAKREKYETAVADTKNDIDLAMSLFQGAGIAIDKTAFGVYNVVTEQENHHRMAKKNDGTESILIGQRGDVMNKAFNVVSEYVTVR